VAELLGSGIVLVLEVPRHRDHRLLADIAAGGADGCRAGIALGGESQVGDRLRERELAFRQPDELRRLHRRHCDHQGPRIGVADILAGQDHEPPREKPHVLASLEHPRQPVEARIGVAAPDAFDQGAGTVVVRVA